MTSPANPFHRRDRRQRADDHDGAGQGMSLIAYDDVTGLGLGLQARRRDWPRCRWRCNPSRSALLKFPTLQKPVLMPSGREKDALCPPFAPLRVELGQAVLISTAILGERARPPLLPWSGDHQKNQHTVADEFVDRAGVSVGDRRHFCKVIIKRDVISSGCSRSVQRKQVLDVQEKNRQVLTFCVDRCVLTG